MDSDWHICTAFPATYFNNLVVIDLKKESIYTYSTGVATVYSIKDTFMSEYNGKQMYAFICDKGTEKTILSFVYYYDGRIDLVMWNGVSTKRLRLGLREI